MRRAPVIAVLGSAGDIDASLEQDASALGAAIVAAGWRLITGGLSGVMAAASRGARNSTARRDGSVIGVVPSYDRDSANEHCDVVIATGAQLGRNITVVASADVVIALAGGAGTLSEIALAWQLDKPVVAIDRHGGWAATLGGEHLDHRGAEAVNRVSSVEDAIAETARLLSTPRPDPGAIGSGWRTR